MPRSLTTRNGWRRTPTRSPELFCFLGCAADRGAETGVVAQRLAMSDSTSRGVATRATEQVSGVLNPNDAAKDRI